MENSGHLWGGPGEWDWRGGAQRAAIICNVLFLKLGSGSMVFVVSFSMASSLSDVFYKNRFTFLS